MKIKVYANIDNFSLDNTKNQPEYIYRISIKIINVDNYELINQYNVLRSEHTFYQNHKVLFDKYCILRGNATWYDMIDG